MAGVRCAHALRTAGYRDRVIVADAEVGLPYDKPPLSKQFLHPDTPVRSLTTSAALADAAVEHRPGARALALDAEQRTVTFEDSVVEFDKLVIASGSTARTLPALADPCLPAGNIRTAASAAAIRDSIGPNRVLVVVGGGFLGLEAASTARSRGTVVHLIEAEPRLLARGVPAEAAAVLARIHHGNGVTLHLGTAVTTAAGTADGRARLSLSDGTSIDCDYILVAVGAVPHTAWLESSSLTLTRDGHVYCGAGLETSVPGIFAVGDCAEWQNPRYGSRMHLEHWTSAGEQAAFVGRRIAGEARAECAILPYVWSDQYQHTIQIAGVPGTANTTVPNSGTATAVVHHHGNDVLGITTIDSPATMLAIRRRLLRDSITLESALATCASIG